MKSSMIIPNLWANEELLDMTIGCIKGAYQVVDEMLIINDNQSYAKNVNKGLRACTGDYIIICNNDISFVQPDWLDHLLKPLQEGYDISSIRTTDGDGWETEDKITEGDKFGSIWCMKREVYEKVGLLDESFGNYFEDLDYHKRAENEDFKVAKNHAGLVEHQGKATSKTIDPEDKAYNKAMEIYRRKWGKVE